MSYQFIKKKIKIHVPVSNVWDVLVKRQYNEQWVKEFSGGNFVTEDWQPGSEIAMKDDKGKVILNGVITGFEPHEFLKAEFKNSDYSEEFRLSAKENITLLTAEAGPVREAEYEKHSSVWDKGLQKIKELSESL